jgi:hypothetical protein
MSKRFAWIALLVALAATAQAESPIRYAAADTADRVVPFGDSGWELYRPKCKDLSFSDLAYLTDDLYSDRAGLGVRFRRSTSVTIDFEIDPLAHGEKLYAPLYDMGIGATTVSIAFHF